MIGNIKKTFPPKTGLREKQLLQDPGVCRRHRRYIAACCMVCAGYSNNTVDSFNYFSTKFKQCRRRRRL